MRPDSRTVNSTLWLDVEGQVVETNAPRVCRRCEIDDTNTQLQLRSGDRCAERKRRRWHIVDRSLCRSRYRPISVFPGCDVEPHVRPGMDARVRRERYERGTREREVIRIEAPIVRAGGSETHVDALE